MKIYPTLILILLVIFWACIFFWPGPVNFMPEETTATSTVIAPGMRQINVYFGNGKLASEASCAEVFPVFRQVKDAPALPKESLEILLQGPTEEEKARGYFTSINSGVSVRAVSVGDGVAAVDFDRNLGTGIGGSCRISAIRKEIESTLEHLPGIHAVIISVGGRSAGALQP